MLGYDIIKKAEESAKKESLRTFLETFKKELDQYRGNDSITNTYIDGALDVLGKIDNLMDSLK